MILTALIDLSMANFINHAWLLFMIALGVFVGAIVLKSTKVFLVELVMFLLMVGLNMDISTTIAAPIILGIIQILLGLFVLYRLYKALDYNYQLILEKTHQSPRRITESGYDGTRRSFL